MTRVKLKTLIGDQFKGVSHAEYTFGDRVAVTGYNGSGKTTIPDMWHWLMTDKDYSLKSNPEVHNDHLEKSEPSVTAVCDVDDKEVTLRKFQKDSRTKKQIEAGAPVRISNQYEINGVPKSQKDFIAYLEELGIDMDNFLLLSHPEIFTSQKSADCRKILFGMVSDITDKEIADSLPDCEELSALLENYTVEEVTAMKRREQKEASQSLDAIPEQIIGMEKSKVDIDVSEFTAQKATLQEEVEALEAEILAHRKESPDALTKELALLNKEYEALVSQANSERVAQLTEANEIIGSKRVELKSMMAEKDSYVRTLDESVRIGNDLSRHYKELADEFQRWKQAEFHADTKCPYCGQDLPIVDINKMFTKFEEDKKRNMDEINHKAKDVKTEIESTKKRVTDTQNGIADLDKKITALKAEIEELSAEREKLETVISVDGTPEGQEVLRKIAEIHHRLNERDNYRERECTMLALLRDKKEAISELDKTIGSVKVNERIDAQIAELKEKQKQYRQHEANAQKILDQINTVSMEKNRRLTDDINSHFEIVRFRLFEMLKNGEVKDCCIPTVRNEDGVYRTFGESANTALMVRAKLDIISGLQKFYGVYLPVILDGAECLDSTNTELIHMDTQLITLSVADTALEVKTA